jgi:hypothetical protein
VPDALAREALCRVALRRYKQHLLQGYPRSARLRDLKSALGKYAGSRLARGLLLAETLGCAPLVKALLQARENYPLPFE